MPTYTTEAIVLKRMNYREADRLVTAFSKDFGKIRFIAKGVRRTKSKLAGSIEPLCRISLTLSKGRNLDTLLSALMLENYLGIEANYEEIKVAGFMAEVLERLTPDHETNQPLFSLFDLVMHNIGSNEHGKLKVYFFSNLLIQYGTSPELNICVRCGQNIKDMPYLSVYAGGIMDENCAIYHDDAVIVSQSTIKILRLSKELSVAAFIKVNMPEANLREAEVFLLNYIKTTFNKSFKSEYI